MQRRLRLLIHYNTFSFILSRGKKGQKKGSGSPWLGWRLGIRFLLGPSWLSIPIWYIMLQLSINSLSSSFFPFWFCLQLCYLAAPLSRILHKQSENIKSLWGKGKTVSPQYLSSLAFFSDVAGITDCPICLQYSSTQFLAKTLNGSDH